MALTVAELKTVLTADIKQFQSGMQRAQTDVKRLEGSVKSFVQDSARMRAVGANLTKFVTLPVLAAGGAAVKMASDLAESQNAANVAFKGQSADVQRWAKDLDRAFGMTQREALDSAAGFQLVTQAAGFSSKQITDLSERAADLGSVFNASAADVSNAIKSGLVGESEPLRRFGVLLNEAKVQAEAYSSGIAATGAELTEAQKQQARLNIIMKESSFAQGDAIKTTDTLAGKMRTLKADTGRAAEDLGTSLIPITKTLAGLVGGLTEKFDDLPGPVKTSAVALVGVAAVAGPMLTLAGNVKRARDAIIGMNVAAGGAIAKLPALVAAAGAGNALFDFGEGAKNTKGFVDDWITSALRSVGLMKDAKEAQTEQASVAQQVTSEIEKQTSAIEQATVAERDRLSEVRNAIGADHALRSAALQLIDAQDALAASREDLNELLARGAVDAKAVAEAEKDLHRSAQSVQDAWEGAAKARKRLEELLRPATPRELGEATDDVAKANIGLRRSQLQVEDAQAKLLELQNDAEATARDLLDAQLDLESSSLGVRDAERSLSDATSAMNTLATRSTTITDEVAQAQRDLLQAERAVTEAVNNQAAAQRSLDEARAGDPEFTRQVADARRSVAQAERELKQATLDQALATNDSREALAALRGEAHSTERQIRDLIRAHADFGALQGPLRDELMKTGAETGRLLSIMDAWSRMNLPNLTSSTPAEAGFHFPSFHSGGVVPGPAGAEVPAILQAGETVIPAGGGGMGGGGITINVTGALDPNAVAEQIHEILLDRQRQSGSLGFT